MLQGCTAWPEETARRYRQQGYWADITLYDMLLRSVAASPDRIALVHGARRLSYAELRIAIDRLAGRLIDLGFQPLDRVVFQLPNSIEFVIAFFALLRIGVIPVLALPAHRREEISHIFAHTKAAGYVVPDVWRGYDYRSLAAEMCRPGAVAAQRARARRARLRIRYRLSNLLAHDGWRRQRRAPSPPLPRRPMKSR